ncbi:GAF domain-containing protein [Sphingomonas sp. RT2P30]|uniref:sensor histidine kinase n=1 Tax=Parasphingomonas halimpatiens TaxID=3096162 RepID=UPI002FC97A7A
MDANPAATSLWQIPRARLCDKALPDLLDAVSGNAFRKWAADDRVGALVHRSATLRYPDGDAADAATFVLTVNKTADPQICLCSLEAASRSDADHELHRLNWALEAYTRSASALIHAESVEQMAECVCRAIIQDDAYALATIILADDEPTKEVRQIASAGLALAYLDGLTLSWSEDVPEGRGPTGRAIRSGEAVVMYDVLHDPIFAHWRDRALRHGIRSSVTVPFRSNEGVVGAVLVYGAQPAAFTDSAVRVFSELGAELAFAMSVLKNRARLKVAEAAQREAEAVIREKQAELARVARALAVGEFASSLSHEIMQPLAGIMTNCETARRWLAKDEPKLDEARAALDRITRDAGRADEIVKRTRSFLTKQAPDHGIFDVNEMIAESLDFLSDGLRKASVTATMNLSPEQPRMFGDRVQIQQVVINLIANAMDALQNVEQRPRVVHLRSAVADNECINISVEDNGEGLLSGAETHLFDHFFTTKVGGMGLGLSISRSIIEAHDGMLWAEAVSPHGVIFRCNLPAKIETRQ